MSVNDWMNEQSSKVKLPDLQPAHLHLLSTNFYKAIEQELLYKTGIEWHQHAGQYSWFEGFNVSLWCSPPIEETSVRQMIMEVSAWLQGQPEKRGAQCYASLWWKTSIKSQRRLSRTPPSCSLKSELTVIWHRDMGRVCQVDPCAKALCRWEQANNKEKASHAGGWDWRERQRPCDQDQGIHLFLESSLNLSYKFETQ